MLTHINTWKYRIAIKHLFASKTTPALIISLCNTLESQLKAIREKINNSNLADDEKDDKGMRLEEVQANFIFLRELADSSIPQSEWRQYDFDGDYEALFNGYLSELYDIGDERVRNNKGQLQKFIWIE